VPEAEMGGGSGDLEKEEELLLGPEAGFEFSGGTLNKLGVGDKSRSKDG
jgi:hypothetical protein